MHETIKRLGLGLLSTAGAYPTSRWWNRRKLLVITYHRVHPETQTQRISTRDSLSEGEFARQVAHIARHYQVVNGEEVRAFLSGKHRLPPKSIFITFDDGYENNYALALPILERHGITAGFFLTTSRIGATDQYLWFDRLDSVLSSAPWGDVLQWLKDAVRFPTIRWDPSTLRRWLKSLPGADRERFVDRLEHELGTAPAEEERSRVNRLLSWEQVREMHARGMTIGSHTATHQILASGAPGESLRELEQSRKKIEEEIQSPCWCFSYPNGEISDFRPSDIEAVRSCGYECAFTQVPGFIGHPADPYRLPRVSMSDSADRRVFLCRLGGLSHLVHAVSRVRERKRLFPWLQTQNRSTTG